MDSGEQGQIVPQKPDHSSKPEKQQSSLQIVPGIHLVESFLEKSLNLRPESDKNDTQKLLSHYAQKAYDLTDQYVNYSDKYE